MPTVEANGDDRAVELYRRHRPRTLTEVVGQPSAVSQLEEMLKRGKVPHVMLFVGPSGCGKTTLARIMARKLNCHKIDFKEINCASMREATEEVRRIQGVMGLAPMGGGGCRVWLLDEVQSLSRAGFAQQALLKMLEDTPAHCYFMLCTTDPTKLLPTVRTRCTTINVRALDEKELAILLRTVLTKEAAKISDAVITRIVEAAQGSPRKALVDLHRVLHLPGEAEQLAAVADPALEKGADDLVRLLFWQGGAKPPGKRQVLDLIAQLPDTDDWEGFRRRCLATAATVLLHKKGDPARAAAVLGAFRVNWFDDAGKSGVVAASLQALAD